MCSAKFDLPFDLCLMCQEILPKDRARAQGGRPRIDIYRILCRILYRLRTGCQWRAIPSRFGASSTIHRRFQQWVAAGFFRDIFEICLRYDNDLRGIDLEWASKDGSMVKAPNGGDDTGTNPTDRGKSGSKLSILTDSRGVPIGVATAAAHVHDNKLVEETLDSVPIVENGTPLRPKNHCMNKGYAGPKTEAKVRSRKINPHGRKPGEPPIQGFPKSKKRRWVVERTNSWHNKWRGLQTRWEREGANYLACVMLASACTVWQSAIPHTSGVF